MLLLIYCLVVHVFHLFADNQTKTWIQSDHSCQVQISIYSHLKNATIKEKTKTGYEV